MPSPYNLRGVPYGTAYTVRPAHGRVHHAPGPAGSVASMARPRGGHVCARCPALACSGLPHRTPRVACGFLPPGRSGSNRCAGLAWLGLASLSLFFTRPLATHHRSGRLSYNCWCLSLTVTGYRRRVHPLLPSINLENRYKSRSNSNLPLPVTKKRLQDPLSLTSTDKTWTRSCGYPPSLEAWALRSMAGKKACSDSSLQAC